MAPETLIPDILDRIDVGVVVLCRDMRIRYWNRFMASHTGRAAEVLLGEDLFGAFPDMAEDLIRRRCGVVFLLGQFAFSSWEQRPYLFECHSRLQLTGGLKTMRQDCTFLPLKDDDGQVSHCCMVIKDVTQVAAYQGQLQKALAQLSELSSRDGLTGVWNRRRLDELVEVEFSRHRRYGSPLAIAMVDIDKFKRLNDDHGHPFGDEVLREVAQCVAGSIRTSDTVGRYGGEEFMLILPGIDGDQLHQAGERFRQAVQGLSFLCEGQTVRVTVSIGLCSAGPRHASAADAIGAADQALYRAKEGGRNRVELAAQATGES